MDLLKKRFILPLFFFFSTSLFAQNDVDSFIDDILVIADNFSTPAAEGAAYQAGAGWWSSATTLEKWELGLSLHGNMLFIPKEKKTFQLSNSDLTLLELVGGTSAELPTAFGGNTSMAFKGEINFLGTTLEFPFDAIDGIDRSTVPHAFLQGTIGLPRRTELTLRAMPSVTINDVKASTYGVGLKHNFNQYFRINESNSVQFAAGLAYSKLNVGYEFEPKGAEGIVMLDIIKVDADLFMLEGLASKKWEIVEIFGAIGVMNSMFDYNMGGSGEYLGEVNTQLDSLEGSQIQFKGDIGFNLHWDRFSVSTIATIGEFFNANLGLHVRI